MPARPGRAGRAFGMLAQQADSQGLPHVVIGSFRFGDRGTRHCQRSIERWVEHPKIVLMERRIDTRTAQLINGVLVQRAWRGKSYAARALYDLGLSLEQAIRILTRPEQRRLQSGSTILSTNRGLCRR